MDDLRQGCSPAVHDVLNCKDAIAARGPADIAAKLRIAASIADQAVVQVRDASVPLERAKLARERADLDEKLRHLESERASGGSNDSGSDKGKKPARGKWLARLGLQGGKDE